MDDQLAEVAVAIRNMQEKMDQHHQELIDAILNAGIVYSSGTPPQKEDSQRYLEEKAKEVQEQINEKNRIIKAMIGALAKRPSRSHWSPIVDYLTQCNRSGDQMRATVVESLAEALPSVSKTTIASSLPMIFKDETTQERQPQELKTSQELKKSVSSIGEEKSNGKKQVRTISGRTEDAESQTRESWTESELTNRNSDEYIDLDATEERVQNNNKEDPYKSNSVQSLLRLSPGQEKVKVANMSSGTSSSEVATKRDPSILSSSSTDKVAAQQQQQAYVISRIDDINQKMEENTALSFQLQKILKEMALAMKSCSSALLGRLDQLEADLSAIEPDSFNNVFVDIRKSVEENLKRSTEFLEKMRSLNSGTPEDSNNSSTSTIVTFHPKSHPISYISSGDSGLSLEDSTEGTSKINTEVIEPSLPDDGMATNLKRLDIAAIRNSQKDYVNVNRKISENASNYADKVTEIMGEAEKQSSEGISEDESLEIIPSSKKMSLSGTEAGKPVRQDEIQSVSEAQKIQVAAIVEEAERTVHNVLMEKYMEQINKNVEIIKEEIHDTESEVCSLKAELQCLQGDLINRVTEIAERLRLEKVTKMPNNHEDVAENSGPEILPPKQSDTKNEKTGWFFQRISALVSQENRNSEPHVDEEPTPSIRADEENENKMQNNENPEIKLLSKTDELSKVLDMLYNDMKSSDEEYSTVKDELQGLMAEISKKIESRIKKHNARMAAEVERQTGQQSSPLPRYTMLKTEIKEKISCVSSNYKSPRRGLPQLWMGNGGPSLEVKQLGSGYVEIKWPLPVRFGLPVTAYQILLDDEIHHKVRNPNRNWAVINGAIGGRKISVVAETVKGPNILIATSPEHRYRVHFYQ